MKNYDVDRDCYTATDGISYELENVAGLITKKLIDDIQLDILEEVTMHSADFMIRSQEQIGVNRDPVCMLCQTLGGPKSPKDYRLELDRAEFLEDRTVSKSLPCYP